MFSSLGSTQTQEVILCRFLAHVLGGTLEPVLSNTKATQMMSRTWKPITREFQKSEMGYLALFESFF